MMNISKIAIFCAAAAFFAQLAGAPIKIVKSVEENPSLAIHYSNVAPALQREIENMIRASNWFNIVRE